MTLTTESKPKVDNNSSNNGRSSEGIHPYGLAAFFLSIGCLLWSLAIYAYLANLGYIEKGIETQGVVVELIKNRPFVQRGVSSPTEEAPIIEYTDSFGRRRFHLDRSGSYSQKYKIGQRVSLLIDPDTSSNIRIKESFKKYNGVWVISIIATVFTLLGFGVLYLELRPEKKQRPQRRRTRKANPVSRKAFEDVNK